ncbi:uncharacterized protein LOC123529597 [Mercenaria mercenaria]|uniref:uncharacterized protein LOC123529597 n=1 Tax=Mercenaria mercenaria TaxID=6596 RepID=UPI00234E3CB7|nr:uncharacterized protein LOC123529597 [Mercenaria mercenaria]
MSVTGILKLTIVIANIMCGISTGDARAPVDSLSSKHLAQTDIFTDLSNTSFFDNDRFHSRKSQYYDPVLKNHSDLKDYLNGMIEKVNEDDDTEKVPARQKRSPLKNCTGLCERSLCPWTMHWNEDTDRVPQFIRYAKCKTDYCNFSFAKLGFFAAFKLGINTVCEIVTTDIFSTKEGKVHWITGWPIACICAKTWSHEQFFSGSHGTPPEMTPHLESDILHQSNDSQTDEYNVYYDYYEEETPDIYLGEDDPSLTNAQRESLLWQERLKKQHSETFEEVMKKQRNRTLTLE